MKHTFVIEPRDLLFLRDARPMAASDAGIGANWPRPDQLWNALINAFHRAWPERQPWEGAPHTCREGENPDSSMRFGALKTLGPFPVRTSTGEVFLPCPLDRDMEIVPCEGTDLPAPLTHAFRARKLGKASLPRWISSETYQRYLSGAIADSTPDERELYDTERHVGVEIDPATRATVTSQLYQAEYLRLRPDVAMAFEASCDLRPKGGHGTVDLFARADCPEVALIGGQQGTARLTKRAVTLLPLTSRATTPLLRWTLLTPALFNEGWRPDWVAPDGRVMLPRETAARERQPGEPREVWRRRVAELPKCSARLIAARVGNPLAFSGWDLQSGPKPTQLAVPAGSCYVFSCGDPAEAQALAAALDPPNRRSALYGEKGFGIGVCSSVEAETLASGSRPSHKR